MNMFLILRGKKKEAGKQTIAYNSVSGATVIYKKEKDMARYRCIVCRYIYDPALGDTRQYIHAGTAFHDLPEDWYCPECGVGQGNFKRLEKCKVVQ